jgi:hypothetical protein
MLYTETMEVVQWCSFFRLRQWNRAISLLQMWTCHWVIRPSTLVNFFYQFDLHPVTPVVSTGDLLYLPFLTETMESCNDDYNYFIIPSILLIALVLIPLVGIFCAFVTEHKPTVNDVFTSYNLFIVLLLSTLHCRWCIYFLLPSADSVF